MTVIASARRFLRDCIAAATTRKGFRHGRLASVLIVASLTWVVAAGAVDPVPVAPTNSPRASSEFTKNTIVSSNDLFYIDYAPTFQISFDAVNLKNRILMLHVTLGAYSYQPTTLYITPTANGLPVFNPSNSATHYCDTPTGECTVTSVWWIDLEAAELANPGMFKRQPINIDVNVGTSNSDDWADGHISIVGQILKK